MSVTEILRDVLIVLVAAKVAAEIATRLKVPAVVGEILAGVLIGPSLLGFVGPTEALDVLAELGVILLLLQVGLELDVRDLTVVGKTSLAVAVLGVGLPLAMGYGVGIAFDYDSNTALFLGAALAATSVGITARVFSDLRALTTIEARTVLGAAVADDVLGLVILTVVVRIATEGSVSFLAVLGIFAVAIAFLVATAIVGARFAPAIVRLVQRYSRASGTLVVFALAFALFLAELADAAQLAPIIGAVVAGIALNRSDQRERIERDLAPLGHVFIPFFFVGIGIAVDIGSFVDADVIGVAAALIAVAVVGKLLAGLGATGSRGDKLLIGLGMLPRGEVGLIFAAIGLQEGILGDDLYASVLLVVVATTLIAPPLLRWRLRVVSTDLRPQLESRSPKPEGGWLWIDDGVIDLSGEPPPHAALAVGLEAGMAIASGAAPGSRLLEWLKSRPDEPLRWDADATRELFEVLKHGNARTWRFLEASGVLEQALPELAGAVRSRRADPHMLDSSQVLRFELVERTRELEADDPEAAVEHARLEHPEWLLLAALILDTAGEESEPVALARRLVQRLDLGAAAEEEIALLVGNPGLLRAAAGRVDGLDEESVLQLAAHIEHRERAGALYLLSLALAPLDAVEHGRLRELFALVTEMLEQPALTGLDARNLVEQRRAEAMRLATGPLQSKRIEHAPRAYLLSQSSADVARQVARLERLPARGEARVVVTTPGPDAWVIDVASRDRPALLAHVSGVFLDHGLDVLSAVVATWSDGAALESFRVRPATPDPEDLGAKRLEAAIVASFDRPLTSPPNPDAEISFDDAGSPWYTLCEVRSPDGQALLHAITVGIAAAGGSVHSARLETAAGDAVDRFELTDAAGRKLDRAAKEAVRVAIINGVTPRRRRFGRPVGV